MDMILILNATMIIVNTSVLLLLSTRIAEVVKKRDY